MLHTADVPGGSTTAPGPVKPEPSAPRSTWPGRIFLFVIALLVLALIWWAVRRHQIAAAQKAAAARSGPPAVSVVEGEVVQKDVPIYLDGLGTVQAYNSVTIHARVDGQIKKVAFTEGQDVHAGDLLVQIDPDPFRAALSQAEAKKAQDEAQLANAQLDLARQTELVKQKIATQQAFDTQQALVNSLTAAVKTDQAAIDAARVQLNYTTITAPMDGRTGVRFVDEGNIVHANDQTGIVVLAQLHPITVMFTLPEQDLPSIQKEQKNGTLTVVAVDRDNSTVLGEGKLTVIDNQIDTTTGTLRFKANFPNEDLRLWPGQFVNARLRLTIRQGGLVVPASVIQRGPQGSFAFVIKPDQTVEARPVKVAQIEAGEALIDDGLKAGERVVVDGQYRLQTGSKVKPATSAKSQS